MHFQNFHHPCDYKKHISIYPKEHISMHFEWVHEVV